MKLKGLLLLILFVFNFSETVFAGSEAYLISEPSGIGLESADYQSCVSDEHCPDLDCCHKNHIHHYLPLSGDFRFIVPSEIYAFPPPSFLWSSIIKEISKPPVESV